MGLSYAHAISILEIIVYIPALFLAAFLVFRHGFRTSAGFVFLIGFTVVRTVGACCDLATISNPSSTGLFQAAAICNSIGLTPLILLCGGLLSRTNESIRLRNGNPLNDKAFALLRIIALVGLILSIVALSNNITIQALLHPPVEIKIGMILFFVTWGLLVLILITLCTRYTEIDPSDRLILPTVGFCAVLILVRLVYSLLVWFVADKVFNFIDGSETARLLMSVLEEIVVVIVCLGVGLTLKVRAPSSGPADSEGASGSWNGNLGSGSSRPWNRNPGTKLQWDGWDGRAAQPYS